MREENGRLHIQIRDNGQGFDSDGGIPAGHYGLLGLRERARLAHGELAIESGVGEGTILRMTIPVGNSQQSTENGKRINGKRGWAMIRILIADDHLVVREGLQLILGMEDDLEVVGEAADGETAVRLTGELQPDVILMDLRMPGMGGLAAIEQILAQWPEMAIVILTTYNEDDLMMRGLQAGARGFLLKDTGRETLFHTIRAAARGETLLQPEIMAAGVGAHGKTRPAPEPIEQAVLTERELEVINGRCPRRPQQRNRPPIGRDRTHHQSASDQYLQ